MYTPPRAGLPGKVSSDFDLGDISLQLLARLSRVAYSSPISFDLAHARPTGGVLGSLTSINFSYPK